MSSEGAGQRTLEEYTSRTYVLGPVSLRGICNLKALELIMQINKEYPCDDGRHRVGILSGFPARNYFRLTILGTISWLVAPTKWL